MLKLKDTANWLGISEYTLRQLTKKEEVPYRLIGGKYMYIPEELTQWLKSSGRGKNVS
jgi:predicted site-specific integrase-resolvase